MHSTLVRIQNIFGFFTTVVFCVGGLIALTTIISPSTPSAKLELRNVQVYVSSSDFSRGKSMELEENDTKQGEEERRKDKRREERMRG